MEFSTDFGVHIRRQQCRVDVGWRLSIFPVCDERRREGTQQSRQTRTDPGADMGANGRLARCIITGA